MEPLKELINYYVTTKNVYGVEDCFDTIVNLTTNDNFKQIINLIDKHPEKKLETELTIYINEIAGKNLMGLEQIINKKIKIVTNKDAMEDLEEALLKLNKYK